MPKLLVALQCQSDISFEIIVADGGSNDGTCDIAKQAGIKLIKATKGRGRQMNAAYHHSRGRYLLFLHADSTITDSQLLQKAVAAMIIETRRSNHDRIAGHFQLCFIATELTIKPKAFSYYEKKSALNRDDCINGDQGFLLSRQFFEYLGGFSDALPFLEDQKLAHNIQKHGMWITLPGTLLTSARRFEKEGLGRRMILSAFIMCFFNLNVAEFFVHAPALYQQQEKTKRLCLASFFALIQQLNRALPVKQYGQRWLAIGRYTRQNAWQLFFFLDTKGQNRWHWKTTPFLRFYDCVFHPLTNFRVLDGLTAILVIVWFRIAWSYFKITDR